MNLDELRETVDVIDADIVKLLNKRVGVAIEIGLAKKKMNVPVADPNREISLMARIHSLNDGEIGANDLEGIYRQIISACTSVQK